MKNFIKITLIVLGVVVIVSSKKSKAQKAPIMVNEIQSIVNQPNFLRNTELKDRMHRNVKLETKFYPNPSAGILNIAIKELTSGPIQILIYDKEGRLQIKVVLVQEQTGSFQTTINASELLDGIYHIVLKTENEILQKTWNKG